MCNFKKWLYVGFCSLLCILMSWLMLGTLAQASTTGLGTFSAVEQTPLQTGFQTVTLTPANDSNTLKTNGGVFPDESTLTIKFMDGDQLVGTKTYTHGTNANVNQIINSWIPDNYQFNYANITPEPNQFVYLNGNEVHVWTNVFDQTVIINVLPIAPQKTTISVHYVDESGSPISGITSKSFTQEVNSSYDVSGDDFKPVIPGYTLDTSKLPTNATGIVGTTPISVTYVYRKNPVIAQPVTVKYVDENHQPIADDQIITGYVGDSYNAAEAPYKVDTLTSHNNIYQLVTTQLPTNATGPLGNEAITVTYVYRKVATTADNATVIVNYVDRDNHLMIKNSQSISGKVGDPYQATGNYQPSTIVYKGDTYTLDTNQLPVNVTGTFSANTQFVTFYYFKKQTPTPPNPNPEPTPNPQPTPSPAPGSGGETITTPNEIVSRGTVVYAINRIYLYQNPTFKINQRTVRYVKKPRIYRPMFVVTGYGKSTSGRLRYKVRDVNHLSKTRYKTGYITTQATHVAPVYYQKLHTTITVINPTGVNSYAYKNLTGKVKNYKQGTVLKIDGIVQHRLTTRFVLRNGNFITANRKLVQLRHANYPVKVKTISAINRYSNANFTKKNGRFKAGTILKVYHVDYSWGNNFNKRGTLRYRIAGGYITANTRYIKPIK